MYCHLTLSHCAYRAGNATMEQVPLSKTTAKDTTPSKPKPRTRTTISESLPENQDAPAGTRQSKSVSEAEPTKNKKATALETSKKKSPPPAEKVPPKNTKVTSPSLPSTGKLSSLETKVEPSPPPVEKISQPETKAKPSPPLTEKVSAQEPKVRSSPPSKEKLSLLETKVTRPSPPPTEKVSPQETKVRPSPPKEKSSLPETKATKSAPPRPSPPRTVTQESNSRPSATQASPSSDSVTATDARDSQTPKETSITPAKPVPLLRVSKPPQKKIAIKSDASWIKKKDSIEKEDSHSSLTMSQTMPDLSPSPDTPRKQLPYRSHPIITTPTPSSGLSYVAPSPSTSPKLPAVPASKFNRSRAGTVLNSKKQSKVEATKNKQKRSNSFTRSTSDDSIAAKLKVSESSWLSSYSYNVTHSVVSIFL